VYTELKIETCGLASKKKTDESWLIAPLASLIIEANKDAG